jgi:predicted phage-related endonuclease
MLDLATMGLSPEQKERRRNFIGGSDAHHIISGDWQELWEIKTGRREYQDLSDILAVMMGVYTEPFNLAWYARRTGRSLTRCGEQVVHPQLPFLGVTLDGMSETEDGHPATVQAKHVGNADEAMELRYTAQNHHEAACMGVEHYIMSVFVGNNKWVLIEREVDPFFTEEYLSKCQEFWQYVELDVPPPAAAPLPVPPPRKLRTVDFDGNNQFASMAVDWIRFKGPAKAYEEAAKGLKSMVEIDVGLAIGHGIQIKRGRNDALYITEVKK